MKGFDSAICAAAKLDELSPERLGRYLALSSPRGFPGPGCRSTLEALHVVRDGLVTNAAILLFGYRPQTRFKGSDIVFNRFSDTQGGAPSETLTCGGTIFEGTDMALYLLDQALGARMPSQVQREAVLNAAIHRDYSVRERTQVNVYPDRIEVVSAGGLPPDLSLDQLRRPHSSVPNNPLLAEAMALCGKRRRGAGTTDMIASCRKHGLPEPEFQLRGGFFVTILHLAPEHKEQSPVPPATPEPGPLPAPPAMPKPKRPKPEPIPDPQTLPLPIYEVVQLLGKHGPLNAAQILKRIGLEDRVNLHKRYLKPAMQARLVELTIPDQPKSKLQQYRLTARGRAVFARIPAR
ncbi:MAG: hypothetical protein NTY77_15975 [Elusimicrobia bacterium]|nr:hypothetical protein [Elusimicrobiota bacterium]